MSFSSDQGYIPVSINTIMLEFMTNINEQFGTSYTAESFVGTNFYKYFYATAQKIQLNETKTSEVFLKLQDYFRITNERIQRPVATNPGLIEAFSGIGYVSSVKPTIEDDAGKIFICVDVNNGDRAEGDFTVLDYASLTAGVVDTLQIGATVFTAQASSTTPGDPTFQAVTSNEITAVNIAAQVNAHSVAGAIVRCVTDGDQVLIKSIYGGTAGNSIDLIYTDNGSAGGGSASGATLTGGTDDATYAAKKLIINTLISNSVPGGIFSQGSESSTIALTNGQSFDFKFYLPNQLTTLLRLTTTLSENNQLVVSSPDDVKEILLENIQSKYRLGLNFEPQRYFSLVDATWCSNVLLEYSHDNGLTWQSSVYEANFDELFEISLANMTVIEA